MSYNILIVDDSMLVRAAIKRTIDMVDIDTDHVYEASNGIPSSRASSNRLQGITMFFGNPKISINCNRTNITLFSSAIRTTSLLAFFTFVFEMSYIASIPSTPHQHKIDCG